MLNWAVIILIGIFSGVIAKFIHDLKTDYKEVREQCYELKSKSVKLETKMDIYLHHAGFDLPKVDKAIRDHMEELQQNDRPTVGCINISSLYRAG